MERLVAVAHAPIPLMRSVLCVFKFEVAAHKPQIRGTCEILRTPHHPIMAAWSCKSYARPPLNFFWDAPCVTPDAFAGGWPFASLTILPEPQKLLSRNRGWAPRLPPPPAGLRVPNSCPSVQLSMVVCHFSNAGVDFLIPSIGSVKMLDVMSLVPCWLAANVHSTANRMSPRDTGSTDRII